MARSNSKIVPGHSFAGWMLVKELSDEEKEFAAFLRQPNGPTTWDRTKALEASLSKLEGDVVAVCEWGWRGRPQDWHSTWQVRSITGDQHISHVLSVEMKRAIGKHAAVIASASLKLTAVDWSGDPAFADWLRARADYLQSLGFFDGETWPTETSLP